MSDNLLVPVQLHAFVLNPAVCNEQGDDGARIVPITQPNYTFLRLDNFVVQHDVLRHIDSHNSAPASKNSRMTDLGARNQEGHPAYLRNRHGVYIHWILPQVYRTGVTSADSVSKQTRSDERLKRGLQALPDGKDAEVTTPEFIQPPTRWLVVRKLDMSSVADRVKKYFHEYQAWVIESDYLWALDDIPLEYDLEVDVSPFVMGAEGSRVNVEQQAEVFIGRKTRLEDWKPKPEDKHIDITLLRSNNELFADFQLHNSNVFSMLDNFDYVGDDGETHYLENAKASYYLFGWHSDNKHDPLWDEKKQFTHAERLESLFMTLKDTGIPETNAWLNSKDSARLCCHGAMYDVTWDHANKPANVPADVHSARIQDQSLPVLSLGTTPLDALTTYCAAHKSKDPGLIGRIEADIIAIEALLHTRDDGVEGQREAADTVYNWNFERSKAGTHFELGSKDASGAPTIPNSDTVTALREVNEVQQLLDACERMVKQRRWDMFSRWWKYVSDVSNQDRERRSDDDIRAAERLATRIQQLESRIVDLRKDVEDQLDKVELSDTKQGAQPFYYRGRDPTLLVGGVESGWPIDFSENLAVRLPVQTVSSAEEPPLTELISLIQKVFTDETSLRAAGNLLKEFYALQPNRHPAKDPPQGQSYPQFHESFPVEGATSRDEWGDTQPWFPLFVEWEVEYFHIPFDKWSLDETITHVSKPPQMRYGIDVSDGKPLWEKLENDKPHDVRVLSGRVLILPQPSFSLRAKVRQLFSETPPSILDQYIEGKENRDQLLKDIEKLPFLSCPLTGLTEGLVTLHQGTHIKPENKQMTSQGENVSVFDAAEFRNAGLTKDLLAKIMGNSALTPFASSVNFIDDKHCPFKPVGHGQMRFRKLNIIDKFGQAILAVDPQPRVEGPPPLYPCISNFYEPQHMQINGKVVANTVLESHDGHCEFIQLPPQINQDARLNANFVVPTTDDKRPEDKSYWRPTMEWEMPIWGWILTNYADYGIQLFLADGTFYGEVRIGGADGSLDSPKWSPFEPPKDYKPQETARLDALIERLTKPHNTDYIKGFWTMLTTAIDSLPPTPSAYAQFLGSVVGKPFALVNMGWSVELSGPPFSIQSTSAKKTEPERLLINSDIHDEDHSYIFQVKLGDKERAFDGLVGYFEGFDKPDPETNEELKYDVINTYFIPRDTNGDPIFGDNFKPVTSETYPKFRPYWVPPVVESKDKDTLTSAVSYADQRNSNMSIFGAIIDPFTSVHAYSSFLPAKELSLPSWTCQSAMNKMLAFLHAGPMTLTSDIGPFQPDQKLTIEKAKQKPPRDLALLPLGSGDWNWLQPYVDRDSDIPAYNAFGIDKKGNLMKPGFEKGPYTAIEGFLQLRRPLMAEKADD
ncbi:cell surface receptor IPT/TIG domain-containing protein [Fusarium austroafricanum]|uniref:Cell surface receptor IPT/TIG domain-containing protein n=1 Tax=Fusarium austroafricanum TaxID=2364996 RepID=A0A8H4NVI2_9HYPO|nr:cell surface receptor IPT/TIG domain-containing protein [Fusarium austroafricanum]